jgi:uncharacterized protein DUF1844
MPAVSEDESEQDADDLEYASAGSAGMPPVDFNLVVLSLNASALMHLGATADSGGRTSVNLPLARHTIDMLGVLEEKTRGNLSGEEERLLHQVLFDLRMRFTNKIQSKS